MRSNASTMVKTYSCGYPRDLGRPSATRLPFVSTTSLVSQTQPTPARIAFSITHGEVTLKAIRAGVGWVWLARLFSYKHSDGGGCTVVLVVLTLVSLTSHKKVFRMKTSACRDGTLKNQPNKMGTTPQHIYTIPTSCAILPTMLCVC